MNIMLNLVKARDVSHHFATLPECVTIKLPAGAYDSESATRFLYSAEVVPHFLCRCRPEGVDRL